MTKSFTLKGGGREGVFFLGGSAAFVSGCAEGAALTGGLAAGAFLAAALSWSAGLRTGVFGFPAVFDLAAVLAGAFGFGAALGFADDWVLDLFGAGGFFFTIVFTDVLGGVALRTAFAFAAGLLFAIDFFATFAGFLARAVGLAAAFRAAAGFVGRFLADDDLAGVFLGDFAAVFFTATGFFADAFLALTGALLEDVFAVLDAVLWGAVFLAAALRAAAFAAGLRVGFAVPVFFVAMIPITVAIVETSCRSRGIYPAYSLDLLYELAALG